MHERDTAHVRTKNVLGSFPGWPSSSLLSREKITVLATQYFDLFKSWRYPRFMEKNTVRTSLDIPVALHRRLHEAAGRQGCSARQLILRSIERVVDEIAPERPLRRLNLDPPIIPSKGRKPITDQEIYDLIEFP
jgi:hypothetical protein